MTHVSADTNVVVETEVGRGGTVMHTVYGITRVVGSIPYSNHTYENSYDDVHKGIQEIMSMIFKTEFIESTRGEGRGEYTALYVNNRKPTRRPMANEPSTFRLRDAFAQHLPDL